MLCGRELLEWKLLMVRNYVPVLCVLVLAVGVRVCLAAEPELTKRLEACVSERDDARRLACYDREVAQLVPAARKQAAMTDTAAPANAAASAEDSFGVYGSDVARKRNAEDSRTGTELKRLTATVTAISQRPRGELLVTLDNGQVWLQKQSQSYFPIRIGDEVTITSGALGSFHLAVSGRSTQVTRMQ